MKTLLFDFDGTIADSFGTVVEIFYELTGHPRIDDPKRVQELRRLPMLKVAKELRISPLKIPNLLVKGRAMMRQHIDDIPVCKGMDAEIKALHKAGYKMYVLSSNSAPNVRKFLKHYDLNDYFKRVYGGVGLLNKSGALKKVMRQNHLKPEDCIYVGDEARDVEGARRAGVQMIAVAWGYNDPALLANHHPDAIIKNAHEITEILKQEEKEN